MRSLCGQWFPELSGLRPSFVIGQPLNLSVGRLNGEPMNLDLFASKIRSTVPVGTVFQNPGGGTSEILKVTEAAITYRRGNSTVSVSIENLFNAYISFQGQQVSSSALKAFAPSVFDSKARPAGHSCNATFLLLILRHIGVAGDLGGNGVKGAPYFVHINGISK